ncbi:glycosyltransferase family 2 protein [uncultured Kriegella sp.]|uniref:glycosyltransferase family 2 protein n=1 Tax=uncultured Kriegella sp. TaxID=1798910 RepID=UPI0030D7325D
MKTTAVLLTVFNRKEKTLEALQNLFAQQLPNKCALEVYLVDDGCTDGTSEAVTKTYPQVHIITGSGNLYWNRGMLLAWETAAKAKAYDYYLWLNDDTVLHPFALSVLLMTAKEFHNEVVVVGSTSALNDEYSITYGGRTLGGRLIQPNNSAQPCAFFNGNIVLIPKYVFEKVGTNDPVFRHALGDFDYGKRANKLGIQNMVAPGVLGQCDVHEDLPVWCNPRKPFKKRWKAFHSPLGNNPEEFFVYEKRHNGLPMACFHYITNHIRVVCPILWKYKI